MQLNLVPWARNLAGSEDQKPKPSKSFDILCYMLLLSVEEPAERRDIGNLPIVSAELDQELETLGRNRGLT